VTPLFYVQLCAKCITKLKFPAEKALCDVLVSSLADQLTATHELEGESIFLLPA
jgi:hypothetical protein